MKKRKIVRCSFCYKSPSQVGTLIEGPDGVFICDECVEICTEIISERAEAAGSGVDGDQIT